MGIGCGPWPTKKNTTARPQCESPSIRASFLIAQVTNDRLPRLIMHQQDRAILEES
jgi:hypothetical protein